jgi:hypothetical protein
MDVTKNIKDAGYIAVGAGVIGFQQAQVRRREIGSEVTRRAQDARSCAQGQLGSLRSQVVTQTAEARTNIEGQALGAWELATTGISGVTTSISGTATGLAGTATALAERTSGLTEVAAGLADDVRELVEPVVGEARVRVEPLVEQLQAVPEHVVRAVDAGRSRVLGLVGIGGAPATAA